MSEGEEIPVAIIWTLQRRLDKAIRERLWDECAELAQTVTAQLKLAMNLATSHTAIVHLEGVFGVGTMQYDNAPPHVKRVLNKMNRIIRTARKTIK